MCMAVYIASNEPLPLVPWDELNPGFHVAELSGDPDIRVREQFDKPYIVYAARMRVVTETAHGIVSFVFNTALLALTVNIAGSTT